MKVQAGKCFARGDHAPSRHWLEALTASAGAYDAAVLIKVEYNVKAGAEDDLGHHACVSVSDQNLQIAIDQVLPSSFCELLYLY
jgi:hypothetical protein